MDYIQEYQLARYRFESELERARYMAAVKEAYALSKNGLVISLEEAEIIHEGISDSVSNGISKLVKSIVTIIEKFLNEARNLTGANKKWLTNDEIKK